MANRQGPHAETGQPKIYQIRIQGHLGRHWADRFEGLSITLEADGTTMLTGPVVDQAALHGLLRKIRDLGLTLLALDSVDADPHDPLKGDV